MSQVSSSPVFTHTRDEFPFDASGSRGTVSASGIQPSLIPTNARTPAVPEFLVGSRMFHHEGGLGKAASELTAGMFRSSTNRVHKAYDARAHFEREAWDEDNILSDDMKFNENPYDETGKTDFDVEFAENRIRVPQFMELKSWAQEDFPKIGLRAHAIIENKTGINLTFYIKASSPLLHVKETVDWLLPSEKFKIHMKTLGTYDQIANDFLLVYAFPIFFPEQLDKVKLQHFWNVNVIHIFSKLSKKVVELREKFPFRYGLFTQALGTDLNPTEFVECHKISKLTLCPQLQGEYSILSHIGASCRGWFSGPPLVHLSPAIDIQEHEGCSRFWTPKENDMEISIACQLREMKRATHREIQKRVTTERNWIKVLSTFALLILGTAMLVCFWLEESAWPTTVEIKVFEDLVLALPPPSTISIHTPPSTIFTPSPEEIEMTPEPEPAEVVELGWGLDTLDPKWGVFLVTRGIWTMVTEMCSFN